jgi:biotin carboxyl carrier protein
MKFFARVDGVERTLEVKRLDDGRLRVHLVENEMEGRVVDVDAVETAPGSFSLLIGSDAFEVGVQPQDDGVLVRCGSSELPVTLHDPRAWRRGRGGALEAEGRQQVAAPMPGKIVRVLVAAEESVKMGQGLVVVEAMKMQNEIRAPRSGTVERVAVREGQAVSAGELLVIIVDG